MRPDSRQDLRHEELPFPLCQLNKNRSEQARSCCADRCHGAEQSHRDVALLARREGDAQQRHGIGSGAHISPSLVKLEDYHKETHVIIPPPTPLRARKMHKVMRLGAKPQTRVQTSHQEQAAMSTLLCPKTAPSRPPINTNVPCVSG